MKNTKVLLGTLALATTLAIPALTHANVYEYVNTLGNLETVNAATPRQALTIPSDIAAHSGVLLIADTTMVNTYPVTTTTTTVSPVTTTTTSEPSPYTTSTNLPLNDVGTYTSATSTVSETSYMTNSNDVLDTVLTLNQNGTATLTTNYTNGDGSEVQNGTWSALTTNGGNEIQLNLNGNQTNGTVNAASTIIFDQSGMTLTASSYPSATYPQGLVLTMLNSNQNETTSTTMY